MTTRLPDWRSRLARYYEGVRKSPFEYGATDCACFAAGAVEAMTGVDPMASIRGRYKTVKGGLKVLRDAGAKSLVDLVARNFEEVHPSAARVGDIAVMASDGPFGAALGVVAGERVMAMSEAGLDSVDRSAMTRAFRV